MDDLIKQGQWWWPLIAPVAAAAFALVGAWLGAKLGTDSEHKQWLRNEKRKVYLEYLGAGAHMSRYLNASDTLTRFLQPKMQQHLDVIFESEIDVFAPSRLEPFIKRFNAATVDAFSYTPEESDKAADEVQMAFDTSYAALKDEIIRDLKISQ